MIIPREFREKYKKILGSEAKRFFEYCRKPLRKSIRVNTLKIDYDKIVSRLEPYGIEPLEFYDYGFYIDLEKPGNTLEYFMGYYYVQEVASMVPVLVMDVEKNSLVLDLCASPGSKSTQISQHMENTGTLIANDISYHRLKLLRNNLERMGCVNAIVINKDGRFLPFREAFDYVLVDAPCSSEGVVRKDWKALSSWSQKLVKAKSILQKQLIASAIKACKKNGVVVYSTCTLSPEENEEVIDFALNRFDVEVERVKLKGLRFREGIVKYGDKKYDDAVRRCVRIWPQDNDTEGFFVARLRRYG